MIDMDIKKSMIYIQFSSYFWASDKKEMDWTDGHLTLHDYRKCGLKSLKQRKNGCQAVDEGKTLVIWAKVPCAIPVEDPNIMRG